DTQAIQQSEKVINGMLAKLAETSTPLKEKAKLHLKVDAETREIVNRIISLNLNQDKIKRLTNKIKTIAAKIRECEDELNRYEKRLNIPYNELQAIYNKVLAKKITAAAFKKLTGYTMTAIESTMTNITTVESRRVRIL